MFFGRASVDRLKDNLLVRPGYVNQALKDNLLVHPGYVDVSPTLGSWDLSLGPCLGSAAPLGLRGERRNH